MYRPRRNATPGFRMPVTYDPVQGLDHTLAPNRPYCRFILDSDLTQEDDRAYAWLYNQWGPGNMHPYSNESKTVGKICVFNYETEEEGVYKFQGLEGDAGLAVWDSENNWLIIDLGLGGWYVGKVSGSTIAQDGGTGTVERHDHMWVASGQTFEVTNPHDISLPVDLKVRWTKYPGWDGWIVEPWHWTEC